MILEVAVLDVKPGNGRAFGRLYGPSRRVAAMIACARRSAR
jgi:hypothetical protein